MYDQYIYKMYRQQTLTFYYNVIKDWNLLPNALKNIKNLDKFNLNLVK